MTIWGSYFTGATAVSFGADITTNSFTVDSATQITASITIGGSAAPGLRNVSVTTPAGTATLPNGFTVVAMPSISSVSPSQAAQGETLSVTITGTNLLGVTSCGLRSGDNCQQLHCEQQHPDNSQHHCRSERHRRT